MKALCTLGTLCALFVMCLALTGCEQEQGKTHQYVCSDGTYVYVFMPDAGGSVTVRFGGKKYKLEHVPSGSGVKYSNGEVTFWSKGKEAFVEINGEVVRDGCKLSE